MRYNLYLLQFNNYYNRQLKKLSTLEEYQEYQVAKIMDCNIDIKDAINTKIIINYKEELSTPNYLLLEDKVLNKITKWFVIECTMTRGLQYSLTIRRDVIADYFDTIRKSPCIIQKGFVDNSSVLVFNKEEQEYNKIKTKEILIKDYTKSAWIVGFIGRDAASDNDITVSSAYKQNDILEDFDYNSLPQSVKDCMVLPGGTVTNTIVKPFEDKSNVVIQMPLELITASAYGNNYYHLNGNCYTNGNGVRTTAPTLAGETNPSIAVGYYGTKELTTSRPNPSNKPSIWNTSTVLSSENNETYNIDIINEILRLMKPNISSNSIDFYNQMFASLLDTSAYINYKSNYDDKICKINNVFYRCKLKTNETINLYKVSSVSDLNTLKDNYLTNYQLENINVHNYDNLSYVENRTPSDIPYITVYGTTERVYLELTQINTDTTTIIPKVRNHLYDAPYDMFVMPYSDDFKYAYNNTIYTCDKDLYLNMAVEISQALGEKAYDIQIVPYCPFTELYDSGLDPTDFVYDFSLLSAVPIKASDNATILGHYYFATQSSGKQVVTINETLLRLNNGESYKEITQLYKYILCSPNEDSKWEFNPAMNKGVRIFNYSFDYKPYSSYIKLQPKWDYLYGASEYNGLTDKRGLVYNGQYSITQLSSAWENYINNNKNYQQIFDTNINTELTKFNMNQTAQWETVGMRNFSLNPVKAVLGIIGEDKQMEFDKKVFDVDLAAQRKLFGYQLDNIQNQPDTIRKLTSINIDFRIYPFVEIYEATEEEQLIFRDNIKYNGMTIMATGYIENYLKPNDETFIKATLIRFNEFVGQENDYTLVQNINFELDKGIYITKEE